MNEMENKIEKEIIYILERSESNSILMEEIRKYLSYIAIHLREREKMVQYEDYFKTLFQRPNIYNREQTFAYNMVLSLLEEFSSGNISEDNALSYIEKLLCQLKEKAIS